MRSFTIALAVMLAAITGALIATMVGYAVDLLAGTQRRLDLDVWLMHPTEIGWWPWPILGGVVGALRALSRSLERP